MKDMERQKFEGEWKNAFGEAEVSPSENLWTNIELDLVKAETENMKKRVLFYKLLAAASISFAMCVAGAGVFYYRAHNNAIAQVNSSSTNNDSYDELKGSRNESSASALNDNRVNPEKNADGAYTGNRQYAEGIDDQNVEENESVRISKGESPAVNDNRSIISKNTGEYFHHSNDGDNVVSGRNGNEINKGEFFSENTNDTDVIQKPDIAPLTISERVQLAIPQQQEVDPFVAMMARLERREKELREEDSKLERKNKPMIKSERLWTSVGFAAGSFTSTNSSANSFAANRNQTADGPSVNYSSNASKDVASKQSQASGTTYSLGLNIGGKVSNRWVIQGGVNYLTQNSSYESSSLKKESDNNYAFFSLKEAAKTSSRTDEIKPSAPYDVSNSLQFISVPVQAGFIALKKKVGIQINTGVSTDLFLQSTTSAVVNDNPQKVRDGWSSDSPYRTVNFSGLLGTEISYRFGEHYRLALNPGLRYPFGSIYKSEIGVKAIPLTLDVGLKFRYIFY